MANERVELIIQAKDLATEAIKKLEGSLKGLPEATEKVNKSASGLQTTFTTLKQNWLALSAAAVAAGIAIKKAIDFAELGAKAQQAEESFKQVTHAYGVNADALLAKMKEVSAGIIDDSNLMQRAVKALQQGLDPTQIVSLLEVARSSARVAGIDVASAFDKITEATANQMTRGLKSLGIVIDQNKAYEDYAKKIGVSVDSLTEMQQSQALANAAIEEGRRQMQAMGEILENNSERIQKAGAQWNEFKETIGKGLLSAMQGIAGAMYWLSGGAMTAASGVLKLAQGFAYLKLDFETAKELSKDAGIMFEAAGEIASKGMNMWEQIGDATEKASESTEGFARSQRDMANASANAAAMQKKASEQFVAIKEQEAKTLKAVYDHEIALEEQKLSEGITNMQSYVKERERLLEDYTNNLISLKEKELSALKEIPTSDPTKIKAIEEEITQIRLSAANEQIAIQNKVRDNISQSLKTAEDSHKKYADKIIELEKKIRDVRMSTEETIRSLAREGMTAKNAFEDLKNEASEMVEKVKEALGRGAFEEAEKYATRAEEIYKGLGKEVKDDQDNIIVSQKDALEFAISKVREIGDLRVQIYEAEKTQAEASKVAEASRIEELKGLASSLSAEFDKITATREVNIDISNAMTQIDTLLAKLDRIGVPREAGMRSGGLTGFQSAGSFGRGGFFQGYGGGDRIPVLAEAGEFFHPKEAVKYYGLRFMEAIRTLKFPRGLESLKEIRMAQGGMVSPTTNNYNFSYNNENMSPSSRMENILRSLASEIESQQRRI